MFKIGSLFSGIGGIELGFNQASDAFHTVWAVEKDAHACRVFRHNFPNVSLHEIDVNDIDIDSLDDIDILTAGFPCQAFSVAGYRKGFDDPRGNVFFRILDFIDSKKPSVLFLENVKNLKGHDKGRTFRIIESELKKRNYFIYPKVLNTLEYGNLPQNRERIYIVGFLDRNKALKFSFPEKIPLAVSVRDLLQPAEEINERYYYQENHRYMSVLSKICFDSVYQWRRVYLRENQKGVCPTLTANMGGGGHNVPIIRDERGIRKLTPRECARLQGFPDSFEFPVSDTQAYKQIGNSVSIPVIKRIARSIAFNLASDDEENLILQTVRV